MKHVLATLGMLGLLIAAAAPASAQHKVDPTAFGRVDGTAKPTAVGSRILTHVPPMVAVGGGNPVTITQNVSQDIVPVTGVSCPTPPNNFYRVFDLTEYGVSAGFDVTSVDVGIEEVGTPTTATINLYRLSGTFVMANLTLIGTATTSLSAANNLSLVNVPVTGAFAGTDRLVVEMTVPLGPFFPGANSAGQSGPTYVRAAGCTVPEPTDLATLGFPESHWVVNVNGLAAPITGPNLFATPGSVSFGRVPVGTTSAPRTVTLINNGTEAVTISSITGSGGAFAINTTGTDLTLDPGQSTTLAVTFSPTENGEAGGLITIVSNAQNSPSTVALVGFGFSPPPNDNFADAIVLAGSGNVTGTNLDATDEPGEPLPSCTNGATGVWWVFTPPANGLLTVSLAGSDFDTVLTLHNSSQSELACDDDGGPGLTSLLANVPVVAGQAVFIRVMGFGGDEGNINLALSFSAGSLVTTPIPPGTTAGGPTWTRPLSVGDGTSGSCTLSGSATAVSYQTRPFTLDTAGAYTITTNYAGYDGYLLLYQGAFNPNDPCQNLIGLNDDFGGTASSQIVSTLATGSYVLVITGFSNSAAGPYTGTIVGPGAAVFPVAGEAGTDGASTWLAVAPNPASAASEIRLAVGTAQEVSVALYDLVGRRVATLFTGAVVPGQRLDLPLDASSLPAGVYVVRATGTDLALTQRLTVVR